MTPNQAKQILKMEKRLIETFDREATIRKILGYARQIVSRKAVNAYCRASKSLQRGNVFFGLEVLNELNGDVLTELQRENQQRLLRKRN